MEPKDLKGRGWSMMIWSEFERREKQTIYQITTIRDGDRMDMGKGEGQRQQKREEM